MCGTINETAVAERAELHLRTKNSTGGTLWNAAEAMELAVKMGYTALAVADYGTVKSFPEIARAHRRLQHAGPGLKVIYGCEIDFVPDEARCAATGLGDGTACFRLLLLAKTQAGLKNLYKILSQSYAEGAGQRVPQALLEQYRKGLLLGSPGEGGELAQALRHSDNESRCEAITHYYDYLEILPFAEESLAIFELGKQLGKPVVATAQLLPAVKELVEELSWLPKQDAFDVAVRYPSQIAGMIEADIRPVPLDKMLLPRLRSSEALLQRRVWERAKEQYGTPLPRLLETRLTQELDGILNAGHAVLFAAGMKLAEESKRAKYPVVSRGCLGASAVAYFAGISEVNPLPPHYLCPRCQYREFVEDTGVASGFDLPNKACPRCEKVLQGDGHDIPFEVALGLDAAKRPDISLNFAGDYSGKAQQHLVRLFGRKNVFYAGGPLGYHPGGMVVVPRGADIYNYTPVQYMEGTATGLPCTHFDFKYLKNDLLKIDVLGHDTPMMLRRLEVQTGVSAANIPMNDRKVYRLLNEEAKDATAILGVSELDDPFIRRQLAETPVKCFGDLMKVFALARSPGAWLANAQRIAQSGQAVALPDILATRDDVFQYLQQCGVGRRQAYAVMERVWRGQAAGKGFDFDTEIFLYRHNVPDWFAGSCKEIQYLCPKAHAASYLLSSVRLLWYKLYYPAVFYGIAFPH